MTYIKKMALVRAEYRDNIDLREYDNTIVKCVQVILPTAEVVVTRYFFEIHTKKEITATEARLIGRKMGKTRIARFIVEHFYDGGFDGRSGKIFREMK